MMAANSYAVDDVMWRVVGFFNLAIDAPSVGIRFLSSLNRDREVYSVAKV
jgi:hypothetical protein